jgi:hypothetical protein
MVNGLIAGMVVVTQMKTQCIILNNYLVRWRNGRRTTRSDNPRANDNAKWVAVNTKQSTSFMLTWSSVQEWFVTIEGMGSNPVLTTK